MNAVKRAIPMQLSALNNIIDIGLGPKNKVPKIPTKFIPINPNNEPNKAGPQLNILPFGILYAISEEPPKIAEVIPMALGRIDGLIAAAEKNNGAALNPKLIVPNAQSPSLNGLFEVLWIVIPFSTWLASIGFMYWAPRNPTKVPIIPPKQSGIIAAVKIGIFITAYEVDNAPSIDNPVVLYTLVINLLRPIHLVSS